MYRFLLPLGKERKSMTIATIFVSSVAIIGVSITCYGAWQEIQRKKGKNKVIQGNK